LQWKDAGTVAAGGNSDDVRNYFYLCSSVMSGVNYFRIKQTDIDGRSSCSEIRTVTIGSINSSFIVLNNPVHNGTLIMRVDEPGEFSFHNSEGKLLWNRQFNSGNSSIDVNNYAKGIYFLKGGKATKKIILR
jgi:hypothetical protein